jgi:hypothetical protein
MKKLILSTLSMAIMFIACEKDPVSSENGQASMNLDVQYVSSVPGKQSMATYTNSLAVDAITITRARFLIRNVKLRSVPEDSVEFVSDPYIIDLNLNGQPNTITVKDIPVNTYDRIDFHIHRLDDDDPRDLAFFQHPDFKDFVTDNRYSMIIEGTITDGNNPEESFVYQSRDNEKQRHFFNPVLVVNESTNQITVVIEINGMNWFKGEEGSLLDPRDGSNQDKISDNLKESINIIDKKSSDRSDDDSYDNGDDTY